MGIKPRLPEPRNQTSVNLYAAKFDTRAKHPDVELGVKRERRKDAIGDRRTCERPRSRAVPL
jgi:hypothetical protein